MSTALTTRCGAKVRSRPGGTCQRAAGEGTDHPGEGRCWHHGGRSPIKHGRYSKVKRRSVRELAEAFERDPRPLDLLPELAQARALYHDYVDRHGDSDTFDPKAAAELLAEISKAAKRIQDAAASDHITRSDFWRVLTEMARAVDLVAAELLTDALLREEFLSRVREAWLDIRLS
ncbi:MAG TPA: hypothetical protein VFQ22_01465 [Longimicrobiales bacterium]|nr:hypothetical protein [Longimicrobiales bacterium]